MWFVFVIPLIIFFAIFLSIARAMFFSHKSAEKNMKDMVATISAFATENNVDNEHYDEQPKGKVCEYCGATVPAGQSKCSACGAKVEK